ncbi:LysR family transcriptional regulator [Pseudactinotalea sp. HY158]|uniref:LysR family transcriptional regulator n=1 Tax=Pseudactinotalea sp. HY158 TaxID=2654547 RepID=UPI00129CE94E|nr:LysR family transcriptional regulator [Pseudactinotalea sp. HY158]QGH70161.1 LysR family transcriptional regulator [Pseudactinotalea sp. HY158]
MDLLRHLRFAITIAEERHFGRAAARLDMSQPPLSQGLQRLERRLGVRLFERDARAVRPTPAGDALLPRMRDVLEAAEGFLEEATEWSSEPDLRVGIAADVEDRACRAVEALGGLGVAVSPLIAGSVRLVDAVRDGGLDLAVVRHPGIVDGTDARGVLTIPRTICSAGGRVAPPGTDLPVVVPPRRWQPAAHDQLVDALRRHRHSGEVIEEADLMARRALVAAGRVLGLGGAPDATGANFPLRLRVILPVASDRRRDLPHLRAAELLETALT